MNDGQIKDSTSLILVYNVDWYQTHFLQSNNYKHSWVLWQSWWTLSIQLSLWVVQFHQWSLISWHNLLLVSLPILCILLYLYSSVYMITYWFLSIDKLLKLMSNMIYSFKLCCLFKWFHISHFILLYYPFIIFLHW